MSWGTSVGAEHCIESTDNGRVKNKEVTPTLRCPAKSASIFASQPPVQQAQQCFNTTELMTGWIRPSIDLDGLCAGGMDNTGLVIQCKRFESRSLRTVSLASHGTQETIGWIHNSGETMWFRRSLTSAAP